MTSAPVKDVFYKDIDLAFLQNPITKDVPTLKNEKAITRSIKNLVMTNRYEKPYQPNTYSNLLYSLFENVTPAGLVIIENAIKNVLIYHEPRATIVSVNVDEDTVDQNTIRVTIVYRPNNSKTNVEIKVMLEKIR